MMILYNGSTYSAVNIMLYFLVYMAFGMAGMHKKYLAYLLLIFSIPYLNMLNSILYIFFFIFFFLIKNIYSSTIHYAFPYSRFTLHCAGKRTI